MPIPRHKPEAGAIDCHRAEVRRYLRFLGCPEQGLDDLAQETLLAGLQRWPTGDAPLPWLLAIARNQLRKLLRDRGRRRELADVERLDSLWQEHVVEHGNPMRDALQQCLAQLAPRSRDALRMRYAEGLDRAEIAARLGLSAEGVKSMLTRVRAWLANCVERRNNDE